MEFSSYSFFKKDCNRLWQRLREEQKDKENYREM